MSVILVLLLIAEVVDRHVHAGLGRHSDAARRGQPLIVLAGVLWGTGDLAHLLIDVGHDVRAARILVARVAHASRPSGMRPDRGAPASPCRRSDFDLPRASERSGYDCCLEGELRAYSILEQRDMLVTLAIVLVVLWALGFLAFHVAGG